MSEKPKLIVFASGDKNGGGSGFQELVENSRSGVLDAEIVAVVSNWPEGGVFKRAEKLGIPFVHFKKPRTAERYRELVEWWSADFVALSGWLKLARGLDPACTINIHPGPLPDFGGKGMYGHRVHESVMATHKVDGLPATAVTMHFVTEEYDRGPIFFEYPVWIRPDDTPDSIGSRVNKIEHGWQSYVTNLVVHGKIHWDGENPESLVVPDGWPFLPKR